MLAEGESRLKRSPAQKLCEGDLISERSTGAHFARLAPLGVSDDLCGLYDVGQRSVGKEKHAVSIAGCDIVSAHHPGSDTGPVEDVWRTYVKALRAGWQRS